MPMNSARYPPAYLAPGHRTDDKDRTDGEKRHNRGVDGANHRLLTARLTYFGEGAALLIVDVRGQLRAPVEDDDGVIERVAQNRQEADDVAGETNLQDRKMLTVTAAHENEPRLAA